MINKQICKMCYQRKGIIWSGFDENRWDAGWLICFSEDESPIHNTEKAPEKCPYQLEQLVKNG